jgi:ATP-dependent DNA helicase RecQ
MALTATASDSLISQIIGSTGMIDPIIILVSPNKQNLIYGMQEIVSIHKFLSIIEVLRRERASFKRTIIYCQQQIQCGQLFQLFLNEMGSELTEPVGAPFSLPQYRLVDCFSKGTEQDVKDAVLNNCTRKDSVLRVIICTVAFGMGVNCTAVTRVIHWGPPNDPESYIQQTGRSGRCGEISHCIMLYGKGLLRHCNKEMLNYVKNTTSCRRLVLFNDFKTYIHSVIKCSCCDICCRACKCIQCANHLSNLQLNN